MRELVVELALGLRRHVLPFLGAHAGRAHVKAGAGGDVTFAIDSEAEQFLESFLAERAPEVAFYSEDRGLVEPASGTPEWVLVVDPIDGTRPALAGFEASCVSVAAAPLGDGDPAMGDVRFGAIAEIKSGALFAAERGAGIELLAPDGARAGRQTSVALSRTTELSKLLLDPRFPRPAGDPAGDGARGADRRLLGGRRRLRPRLGDL